MTNASLRLARYPDALAGASARRRAPAPWRARRAFWLGGDVPLPDQPEPVLGSPDAQEAFQQMMRTQVAPSLRELGFIGPLRHLRYISGDHSGAIRLQKSRYSSKQRVSFTFHVGAPCMGDVVIIYLMPEREPPFPYWSELHAGQPTGPVADSVVAVVRHFALPAILRAWTKPTTSRIPTTPWRRPSQALRPLLTAPMTATEPTRQPGMCSRPAATLTGRSPSSPALPRGSARRRRDGCPACDERLARRARPGGPAGA